MIKGSMTPVQGRVLFDSPVDPVEEDLASRIEARPRSEDVEDILVLVPPLLFFQFLRNYPSLASLLQFFFLCCFLVDRSAQSGFLLSFPIPAGLLLLRSVLERIKTAFLSSSPLPLYGGKV